MLLGYGVITFGVSVFGYDQSMIHHRGQHAIFDIEQTWRMERAKWALEHLPPTHVVSTSLARRRRWEPGMDVEELRFDGVRRECGIHLM